MNGSQSGEVIRVGEAWRTYINNGCIEEKMPMTAFCRLNTDKTTREEYFSGYIKYMRIWKGIRSRDDLRLSAMGQVDVDPNDPNLVAASTLKSWEHNLPERQSLILQDVMSLL